ncbi:MAG: iron-containing alcohol dehydrogenase [Caldilineaceae bacterium]
MKTIANLPFAQLMPFGEVEDQRPLLLVTSQPAWQAVQPYLKGLNIVATIVVSEATIAAWDAHLATIDCTKVAAIYAVGGGLTADAAKYFAAKLSLPLVVLPTALSVDAFLTFASGIRRAGCVYYIETKVPDRLVLDLDVIARGPATIRAAGITDVLSIATGSWDWKFAEEQGKNPPGAPFLPWAYANAQTILNAALDCAEAAGQGDRDGLKTLYDCLAMEVQLCNQIGHPRPEEGSEHYFAYSAENFTGHGLPHGDLVGPGILLMARLQGQEVERLAAALEACHIPLDRIPHAAIEQTLKSLPAYCQRHGLAFGLAHTLQS